MVMAISAKALPANEPGTRTLDPNRKYEKGSVTP